MPAISPAHVRCSISWTSSGGRRQSQFLRRENRPDSGTWYLGQVPRHWIAIVSLLSASCGGITSGDTIRPSDGAAPLMQDAKTDRPPGAAYELCGSPVSCNDGADPSFYGTTCVCT